MALSKPGIGLSLIIVVLLVTSAAAQTRDDRVAITRRKLTFPRSGQGLKNYPSLRRAVLFYPVISGLRNQEILRRVRSIIQFKNIFDISLEQYRAEGWLEEFDYEVKFNRNYILDLTFTQTGAGGYPDTHYKHFTIDLRRGRIVKAADVFTADKLDQLAGLVNEKLQQELKDTAAEILKGDPDVTAEDLRELYEKLRFEVKNLDEFEVNKDGLVFLYDAEFPRVVQAWEPNGRYRFSYQELKPFLKPDGLLWQFVP